MCSKLVLFTTITTARIESLMNSTPRRPPIRLMAKESQGTQLLLRPRRALHTDRSGMHSSLQDEQVSRSSGSASDRRSHLVSVNI